SQRANVGEAHLLQNVNGHGAPRPARAVNDDRLAPIGEARFAAWILEIGLGLEHAARHEQRAGDVALGPFRRLAYVEHNGFGILPNRFSSVSGADLSDTALRVGDEILK